MLIQDRIQLIMKSSKCSASEFAAKIDVKRSNLSHVLSGRNNPSLDFLAKIISAYPNVNASWLVTGETRSGDFEGELDSGNVRSEVHDEPRISYEISSESVLNVKTAGKEIEKIVFVYTDATFDVVLPNQQ